MSASEFESKVQQELEQLKLRPSDEVWQKVEKELRQKKRRRVIIFFILLAGLGLLSYPGYKLVQYATHDYSHELAVEQDHTKKSTPGKTDQTSGSANESNSTDNNSNNSNDKNNTSPSTSTITSPAATNSSNSSSSTSNDEGVNKEVAKPVDNNVAASSIDKSAPVKQAVTDSQAVQQKAGRTVKAQTQKPVAEERAPAIVKNTKSPSKEKTKTPKEPAINKELSAPPVTAKSQQSPDKSAIEPSTPVVSVPDTKTPMPMTAPAPAGEGNALGDKKDSVVIDNPVVDSATTTKAATPATPKKIKWMLDLSAGISSSTEGALIKTSNPMADQLYSASPIISNGSLSQATAPPSAINPGFSFRVGWLGELKLNKRSSLISGLQYAYKSNHIQVGAYKDTSFSFSNFASQSVRVNAVYRGWDRKDYTNHYHFIQLPIIYQLQLGKGNKLPVMWNIGAGLNYLVANKSLLYSSAQGGMYYKDKDAYNRFSFNLNTAFYLKFGSQRKFSWMVGPEVSLDMSRLVKDAYGNKQYLLYGGVTGRIYIPKKK